jgi:hypothetical protein
MNRMSSTATEPRTDDVDALNEEFQTMLRDAAEQRESRALVKANEDDAAARQESADLLALARSRRSAGMPAAH